MWQWTGLTRRHWMTSRRCTGWAYCSFCTLCTGLFMTNRDLGGRFKWVFIIYIFHRIHCIVFCRPWRWMDLPLAGRSSLTRCRWAITLVRLVSKPLHLQVANPILILLLIPLFDQVIYPVLGKQGIQLVQTECVHRQMCLHFVCWHLA